MRTAATIDWISYTSHNTFNGHVHPRIPFNPTFETISTTPRFGYRQALKTRNSAIVMFDGSTETMGTHYIYSGEAIKRISADAKDGGFSILEYHEGQGDKCTRIDLAIDVFDKPLFIQQIKTLAETNQFTGTAHKTTTLQSSDGSGITIYVGSRTSERFVRIYDKAAQLGQDGAWTRIECEVKGDSARAVARAVMGNGVSGISVVGKSVIRRVCDFACEDWRAVLHGAHIPIGTPKIEEKKTEEWLLSQVATALARFENEYPEKKICERFWRKVEALLSEG